MLMSKLDEFMNKQKGVRRTVLAFCITWTSASIGVGLWAMLSNGLSGPDATFLSAVLAITQIPVGFYFHSRGQDDSK